MFLFAKFSLSLISVEINYDYFAIASIDKAGGIHSLSFFPACIAFTGINNLQNLNKNGWDFETLNNSNLSFFAEAESYALKNPENCIRNFFPLNGTTNGFKNTFYYALMLDRAIRSNNFNLSSNFIFTVHNFMSPIDKYLLQEVASILNIHLLCILDHTLSMITRFKEKYFFKYQYRPQNIMLMRIEENYTWFSIFEVSYRDYQNQTNQISMDYEYTGYKSLESQFIANIKKDSKDTDDSSAKYLLMEVTKYWKFDKSAKFELPSTKTNISYNENSVNIDELQPILSKVVEVLSQSEIKIVYMTGKYAAFDKITSQLKKNNNGLEIITEPAALSGSGFSIKHNSIPGFVYGTNQQLFLKTEMGIYEVLKRFESNIVESAINITVDESFDCSLIHDNVTIISFHFSIPPKTNSSENITLFFGYDLFSQPTIMRATLKGFALQIIPHKPSFMMPEEDFNKSREIIQNIENITTTRHINHRKFLYQKKQQMEKLIEEGIDIDSKPEFRKYKDILKDDFYDIIPKPTPKPKKQKLYLYHEDL